MKVVLLGYMASGKSAVGRLLADNLNMKFVDLDHYIEESEGSSITTIFKNKGEIYFRKIENKYLLELLNNDENLVFSLGGGTPVYGDNMSKINEKAISFYLNATINTLYERLKNETLERPLVADIDAGNLQEFIAKHLFDRNPFYRQADHIIEVQDKSIPQLIKEISVLL